jgi:8-oxo-dGTP pyrophosphatase MutT (NUDIX family)
MDTEKSKNYYQTQKKYHKIKQNNSSSGATEVDRTKSSSVIDDIVSHKKDDEDVLPSKQRVFVMDKDIEVISSNENSLISKNCKKKSESVKIEILDSPKEVSYFEGKNSSKNQKNRNYSQRENHFKKNHESINSSTRSGTNLKNCPDRQLRSIRSEGIIPFFQNLEKEIKFILQQRRDTFEYFDFLLGKWHSKNQLPPYFTLMCELERNRLLENHTIRELWEDIFVSKTSKVYREGFSKAEKKYEEIKHLIPELIENTTSYTKEPPWGFPKGKKNGEKENEIDCALRETEEEIRIPKEKFLIITLPTSNTESTTSSTFSESGTAAKKFDEEKTCKYEEIYQGSDELSYSSIYFLAEVVDFVIPEHIKTVSTIRSTTFSEETGNIFVGSYEECCRYLNPRRQLILKKAYEDAQKYFSSKIEKK